MSASPLHQSEAPMPRVDGHLHLPHSVGQGAGEVVPPIVMGPLAVYLYGYAAGVAVCDELLWGGPKVLGPKVARHG